MTRMNTLQRTASVSMFGGFSVAASQHSNPAAGSLAKSKHQAGRMHHRDVHPDITLFKPAPAGQKGGNNDAQQEPMDFSW